MEDLVKAESFNRIVTEFFEDKGNGAKLVLLYIKSMSAMLSLVSFVRESDIERHLQAENILICESFALEHQNYARHGKFQHVNLVFEERQQRTIQQTEGKEIWCKFDWRCLFHNPW